MPYIKPRDQGFDAAKAAASAIREGTQGYLRGRELGLQDRREARQEREQQAKLKRLQDADEQARIEEQKQAATKAYLVQMADDARKRREKDVTRLFGDGSGMRAEEYAEMRAEIQAGFDRIKLMAQHLDPEDVMELGEEYAKGMKDKIIAEEYARLDGRIMLLEQSELQPLPQEMADQLREAMQEGTAPRDIHQRLDMFERGVATSASFLEKKNDGEGRGREILRAMQQAWGNSEAEVNNARQIMYLWLQSGYMRRSIEDMEMDMIEAAGRAKPQVKQIPVPMGMPAPGAQQGGQGVQGAQGGGSYSGMTREQRIQAALRLSGKAGAGAGADG